MNSILNLPTAMPANADAVPLHSRQSWLLAADHERIATEAQRALELEIETFPKPGLVSHKDSGSHTDMDASTFHASTAALEPFFAELAAAGAGDCPMSTLREIGLRAESAMLHVTGGINTHRGAIFGLGLLCAAAGAVLRLQPMAKQPSPDKRLTLGSVVKQLWGSAIWDGPYLPTSNGTQALRRYAAGGARAEAASGFPSVYQVGLPALHLGRTLSGGDEEAARVQACFALIAKVEDTNLLHRGGREGARFARVAAENFLSSGGVGSRHWRSDATSIHREFVSRRLSPGGCADLLSMTLFVDVVADSLNQDLLDQKSSNG